MSGAGTCLRHDLGHGRCGPRLAKLPDVTVSITDRRARLLATRVATIITAHDQALDVLVSGGFEPLANPVMRRTLAHTVTLAQAFRIRGLTDEAEEAIISRLLRLGIGSDHAAA